MAINEQGGFGMWSWAVSKDPADVTGIIENVAERGQNRMLMSNVGMMA